MSKKNRNMAKWLRAVEKEQEEVLRQLRNAVKVIEGGGKKKRE